jgi:hypothetical protein
VLSPANERYAALHGDDSVSHTSEANSDELDSPHAARYALSAVEQASNAFDWSYEYESNVAQTSPIRIKKAALMDVAWPDEGGPHCDPPKARRSKRRDFDETESYLQPAFWLTSQRDAPIPMLFPLLPRKRKNELCAPTSQETHASGSGGNNGIHPHAHAHAPWTSQPPYVYAHAHAHVNSGATARHRLLRLRPTRGPIPESGRATREGDGVSVRWAGMQRSRQGDTAQGRQGDTAQVLQRRQYVDVNLGAR